MVTMLMAVRRNREARWRAAGSGAPERRLRGARREARGSGPRRTAWLPPGRSIRPKPRRADRTFQGHSPLVADPRAAVQREQPLARKIVEWGAAVPCKCA